MPVERRRSAASVSTLGAPRNRRSVRIDVRRLDALMNLVGELVIARGRLTQLAGELGDSSLEETVSRRRGSSPSCATRSRRAAWCRWRRCSTAFRASCATRRARVGKQVDFVVEGKEIELDRSMLDEIGDSIVHLLRNAIDHGIETPDARVAAGKPADGRLVLSAARDRSAVVIRVSDDGRGIDRDARARSAPSATGSSTTTRTDLERRRAASRCSRAPDSRRRTR